MSYGTSLVWLALMPLATYSVDSGVGGGLFRYVPVVRRGRARLCRSPWRAPIETAR